VDPNALNAVADLNARFGIPDTVAVVEGPGGLGFVEVNTPLARARVCLQGAHLTEWQPAGAAEPVIWLSQAARFASGKSIRGGVPVCWPWFGPHASEAGFPAHGFARTVPWQLQAVEQGEDGVVRLSFGLAGVTIPADQWPHASAVELQLAIGTDLGLSLRTRNLGEAAFVLGEALHTYFRISDIATVQLTGLDGVSYADKVRAEGGALPRFEQSGPVTFAGETDRVYLDAPPECVIDDPGLGRQIVIRQSGRSTIVWTPWAEKAAKMGDLGEPDGWRQMLCVESGHALDHVVDVLPGQTHVLDVQYAVRPRTG